MNVNQALIEEVRKSISDREEYKRKVNDYLIDNDYRIIEELKREECLDIIAMIDPELYLKVKSNIEEMERKSDMEIAIESINDFLDSNTDNYVCISKHILDSYNAIFLISKKIEITVVKRNKNNPFHTYETTNEKVYWSNFIIKCQFNEDFNLIRNDVNFRTMSNNGCSKFKANTQYAALSILESFG